MTLRVFAVVVGWVLLQPVAHARIIDRIAAIVNNEVITLSEIDESIKRRPDLMQELEAAESSRDRLMAKMRDQALDQLIAERLLEAEIRKRDLRATELEIERAFEGQIQFNKTTREKFVAELHRRGLTVSQYREELAKQLQRRLLLEVLFRPKIKVTDEDVKTFYTQNVNAVRDESLEYCASIILRHTPSDMKPADVEAQRRVALDVLERLRNGEDFAALARQFSQDPKAPEGGDIGCFRRGVMVPEFEKAVMTLKKGEVSGLVRTPQGFYVVRVNDVKGSSVLPFEQVREGIRRKLEQEALERQVSRWVEEQRKKSFVDKKIAPSPPSASSPFP